MNNYLQCPNCGTLNDANDNYCVSCGEPLQKEQPVAQSLVGSRQEVARPQATDNRRQSLVSGEGNAVHTINQTDNGTYHTDNSTNFNTDNSVTSVNNTSSNTTNNTVNTYNYTISPEAEKQKKRDEYRSLCQEVWKDKLMLNFADRQKLEAKANSLMLSTDEADEIEKLVRKQKKSIRMNAIQEQTLSQAIERLEIDLDLDYAVKNLKALTADDIESEEARFYYSLAASILSPTYFLRQLESEQQRYFSYWPAFWGYFAYRNKKETDKAAEQLRLLGDSSDYPEDNAILLMIVNSIYDQLEHPSRTFNINNLLDKYESCHYTSPILKNLYESLGCILKAITNNQPVEKDLPTVNKLYLRLFPEVKTFDGKTFSSKEPTVEKYGVSSSGINIIRDGLDKVVVENKPQQNVTEPQKDETKTLSTGNSGNNAVTTNGNNNGNKSLKYVIIGAVFLIAVIATILIMPKKGDKQEVEESITEQIVSTKQSSAEKTANKPVFRTIKAKKDMDKPAEEAQKTIMEEAITAYMSSSFSVALVLFEEALNNGDIEAAYYLSLLYGDGKGVTSDLKKAFNYMKQAAEGNVIKAYFRLAEMYNNGDGTAPNRKQAIKWYEKAVKFDKTNSAKAAEELEVLR